MSATTALKAVAVFHANVSDAIGKAAKAGLSQEEIAAMLAKMSELVESADDVNGDDE